MKKQAINLFLSFGIGFLGCNSSEEGKIEAKPQYNHINKVSLIKIDSTTKCNLHKGYYLLKEVSTDESLLKAMATELADSLKQSIIENITCLYPIMSAVYVFEDESDFKIDSWISMCTITPQNPSGDATDATWRFDEIKKRRIN